MVWGWAGNEQNIFEYKTSEKLKLLNKPLELNSFC